MKILRYIIFYILVNPLFSFAASNDITLDTSFVDTIEIRKIDFFSKLFYKKENGFLPFNTGVYSSNAYNLFSNNNHELINKDSIISQFNYFKAYKPYTNIFYVNGARLEQAFKLQHFNSFGKSFGIAFNYNRDFSKGIYLNQDVRNTSFNSLIYFKTKNNFYNSKFYIEINRELNKTNGGLDSVELFEDNFIQSRLTYNVNLNNSYFTNRKHFFNIDQSFRFLKSDSITKKDILLLKLSSFYSYNKRVFYDLDPLSNIYSNILIDSLGVNDSIFNDILSNKINLQYNFNKHSFNLSTSYNIYNYYQSNNLDSNYFSHYLGGGYYFNTTAFKMNTIIDIGLNGFNKNDTYLEFGVEYDKKNFNVKMYSKYDKKQPEIYVSNYYSNHFTWDYYFNKTNTLYSELSFHLKTQRVKISLQAKKLDNFIYYDFQSRPYQSSNSEQIVSVNAEKKLTLANVHFISVLNYNNTSNEVLLPLPAFNFNQVVYYENKIFKQALNLQIGFDAGYYDEFFGYDYMPATSVYYIQNQVKVGGFPMVDFFINAKVKRANLFIKIDHLNAGWTGYNYILTPNYPLMDRALKMGISWGFFN